MTTKDPLVFDVVENALETYRDLGLTEEEIDAPRGPDGKSARDVATEMLVEG